MKKKIAIAGAGLAGSEAAWQFARAGIECDLYEMRPLRTTAAHKTENPAELVCSNSFKSLDLANAHGLLKTELEQANSLIISCAKTSAIPAGNSLAVDRELFSLKVKQELGQCPEVNFFRQEITNISKLAEEYDYLLIASGPLTSPNLSASIMDLLGEDALAFYDAISPIVYRESINMEIAFKADRYGKGEADYINCPIDENEFNVFIEGVLASEKNIPHAFEESKYFEGCLPIEVMAERGRQTLTFGPLKPVGFIDPRTGNRPYAIVQLRQENIHDTLYNLVGCQTKMKYNSQKEVFRLVPGLENVEFARYGSMHRNTYINAPLHLNNELEVKKVPGIFFGGQVTGVEGYAESTASGLWAAQQIIARIIGQSPIPLNTKTMIGGLVHYITQTDAHKFQPMNSNFGLLEPLDEPKRIGKKEKRELMAQRALEIWSEEQQRFKFLRAQ